MKTPEELFEDVRCEYFDTIYEYWKGVDTRSIESNIEWAESIDEIEERYFLARESFRQSQNQRQNPNHN